MVLSAAVVHAAPRPWANDTVLTTIAERWLLQNVVVGAEALAELDASVTAALALLQGPAWNRTFSDINYTANIAGFWPASNHTVRVRAIATAYSSPGSAYYNSSTALAEAVNALDWWLQHDPQSSNWWYMQIGAPGYNSASGLLLYDTLTLNQTTALARQLARSSYKGETGANLVWEAMNVIFRAVLAGNRSEAAAAAAACHSVIAYAPGTAEGMKADGSFFQHGNQLYSGGYGQSFAYDITDLLALVAGTPLAFPAAQVDLFGTWLALGSLRMIVYRPSGPMWDISVVGRDLTRPYGSSLQFGFGQSGQQVSFVAEALAGVGGAAAPLLDMYAAVLNGSVAGPPAPALGVHYFYQADYAIVTRAGWTASLRMQSTRTLRSECVNDEGIQSLHLADGAVYVYVDGTEYRDIMPAWDWRRIPGTVVRAGPGAAPLTCSDVQGTSTSVTTGGVGDGDVGLAMQRYIAPAAQNLTLDRLHAFFGDALPVRIANISATALTHATIDSRRMVGEVWAGDVSAPVASARRLTAPASYTWAEGDADAPGWLWHAGIGYVVSPPSAGTGGVLQLSLQTAATGAWASIGAAGDYGNVTVPLFTLWFDLPAPHAAVVEYIVVPNVTLSQFESALVSGGAAAFGALVGADGWSAAQGNCSLGDACTAVALYTAGVEADIAASHGFPAIHVSGAGSPSALLLRLNATRLRVAAASANHAAWSASFSVPLTFVPATGSGWSCVASGTVSITAPPVDGSSLNFECALA